MLQALKSSMRSGLLTATSAILPEIKVKSDLDYKVFEAKGHLFVGYYDIDPISPDGKYLLCQQVPLSQTLVAEPAEANISLVSIETGDVTTITTTSALNWQLGSRVRWLSDETIVFNDVANGRQCAVAYNWKRDKVVGKYKYPFWAISPDLKIGASLNFARIRAKRPGYGYVGESPNGLEEVLTLYKIDSGDIVFQIHLDDMLAILGFDCPPGVDPYLNHVTWSAGSSKFLTLFHFDDPNSGRRIVYPILVDANTFQISMFHEEGMFSHHVWIDDDRLVGFVENGNLRRFYLWSPESGWSEIKGSMPLLDGHPSIVPGMENKIVVDSYPDRLGRMSLYMGSLLETDSLQKIATIMNSSQYKGALRCDLHPRVSNFSRTIICDLPMRDGRKILAIEDAFS